MEHRLPIIFLVLVLIAKVPAVARNNAKVQPDLWPDGTPVDAWFKNASVSSLDNLGKQFVLTDFGVSTDSTIVQTDAIQRVIDEAGKFATSGEEAVVVVPQGTFLTASIFLRQGVNLFICQGGRLKGSDRIGDYPVMMTRIEGQSCMYYPAIVNADGLKGVKICGPGTIDGNGLEFWKAFWKRLSWSKTRKGTDEQRPRLLYVSNCKDVEVSGLHLINSPFWTTHFYKCENIKLLQLHIFAPEKPIRAPSSDAVDIDVCRNFLIKNCYMSVNDDAVVLKGGKGPYADKDDTNGANEFILVEDCEYGFCHGCLTCGSESIHDRNVILKRIKVDKGQRLLWLKMRPDTPQLYEYITVEDITGNVKNFVYIRPWGREFNIKEPDTIPISYGEHITIRRCNMDVNIFFNVEKSNQYQLSAFKFIDLDLRADESTFNKSIIDGFSLLNVIVNGEVYNESHFK